MKTGYGFCPHTNKAGICRTHNWSCFDCGFGVGQIPACTCSLEPVDKRPEPLFGAHIQEAVAVVKAWMDDRKSLEERITELESLPKEWERSDYSPQQCGRIHKLWVEQGKHIQKLESERDSAKAAVAVMLEKAVAICGAHTHANLIAALIPTDYAAALAEHDRQVIAALWQEMKAIIGNLGGKSMYQADSCRRKLEALISTKLEERVR